MAITAKNVRGLGLIYRQTEKGYYGYVHNERGDTLALTNELGNIIKDYQYDPFGNDMSPNLQGFGDNGTGELWRNEVEPIDNPFMYAGEYLDGESGLYYLRARYYEPEIGRFISRDSYEGQVTSPMSLNLFTYCSNNPIKFVDPSGHKQEVGVTENTNISSKRCKNKSDDKKNITSTAEFKETYGTLMSELGNQLEIDSNLLAAVILVESSGSGFVDGNLKIRFENHVFVSGAGYGDLFEYDSSKKWKNHNWRSSITDDWKPVHTGKQKDEYAAFNFAKTLNKNKAYESISMGMGQIMGFNYSDAGYDSAKEMYDDFSKGNKEQISGMVKFISNYNNGKTLIALQTGDLGSFISQYNGSGQVDTYKKMVLQRMDDYINAK